MAAKPTHPTRLVVLISGRGSNLQAILDQTAAGHLPVEMGAVISNVPNVAGLARAEQAGIPTTVLNHREFPTREAFDRELAELIDGYAADLIVLAGFMRILSPYFVNRFSGRVLNIHPSLLPKYPGLHTHRRALQAGDREHGASVHFVTNALDGGPVIIQARVAVQPEDDEERLAARVLEKEHLIYPLAILWFSQNRLHMENNQVVLDGQPLLEPKLLDDTLVAELQQTSIHIR